jgi:general secretion pathway protein D
MIRMLLGIYFLLIVPTPVFAQNNVVGISEREIAKRQQALKQAEKLVGNAQKAIDDKNFEAAYGFYLEAIELIPEGVANNAFRTNVLNAFSKLGVQYANQLIERGKYRDAEDVAKSILSPRLNPNYKPAVQLLANLEQPGYYNRTVTPQFADKKDKISTLLTQADGYIATGRYDLAQKRYEQVLNLDAYNNAARLGMEKVSKQRTTYYDESYNETRSRMLWLADRTWESPVRKTRTITRSSDAGPNQAGGIASKDAITRKLNGTIIQRMDLQEASIREVVDFLKQKSRELDTSTDDPKKRGVNIVLKLPKDAPSNAPTAEAGDKKQASLVSQATEDTKITIALNNVPLIEAIRYLTELAGLKYKVEPFAVSIVPITENTEELLTKEYRVSPAFIPASTGAGTSAPAPQAGKTGDGSNVRLTGRANATDYLQEQGVPFPSGAFAQYIPAGSKLVVRNTQSALDLIDTLVEGDMGVKPIQVEIESKFVEISQNNVKELGFDWLLGPFSVGKGVYGNGGTRNGGQALTADYYSNYSFANVGDNPITAGNRSGIGTGANSAITANSLSALLEKVPQGSDVASPAIFGLAGIFTNPQFQMVIRALNQKKGVDLMSAPKVTTKSGEKAIIRIIREFPYPADFEAAKVPPPATAAPAAAPATGPPKDEITVVSGLAAPATPTSFKQRDIGVSLGVTPLIGPDNYTVELDLSPEVVEFEGFINYGSPIVGPQKSLLSPSGISITTLTDNVMNQPIFSVRKIKTNVSIWDGQTVALGGLIREDVQKVQDKVPLLGDIPMAGRLFRSNVDQKIKRNLIVFVTARLMDAEGKPLKQEDDGEETVEPLGLPEDLPPPAISRRSLSK